MLFKNRLSLVALVSSLYFGSSALGHVDLEGKLAKLEKRIESLEASKVTYGIVDMVRVVRSTKAGVSAQYKIQDVERKNQEALRKPTESFNIKRKSFETKAALMSPESREKKQRELVGEMQKLQQLKMQNDAEGQRKKAEIMNSVTNDAMLIIQELSEKEGLALVVEKVSSGTLYMRKPVRDLTSEVIDLLDKKTDKDKKAEEAKKKSKGKVSEG